MTQRLLRRAGLAETVRGMVALALSQRIAQSLAGMPWRAIRATPAPDSSALLALLGQGEDRHLVASEKLYGGTVDLLTDSLADHAAAHGFTDVDHLVEIFGTCADCAAAR